MKTFTWSLYGTAIALCVSATLAGQAGAQSGKELFDSLCVACHSIGGGNKVGPDLEGVTERRSRDWLVSFIKSSQSMINDGDPTAVALYEQFNQIVMPDVAYSEEQIAAVLDYIGAGGSGAPLQAEPELVATAEDVARGKELFQGRIKLENGGPPCNSCHHVKHDAVIGGGVLAKELTSVFGRMGGSGVRSILGQPPFPVMEAAYKNAPLTDREIIALVGFLEEADAQKAFQKPRDYGLRLLVSGVTGFFALLLIYGLLWRRRKTHSVNHRIYERQLRSS